MKLLIVEDEKGLREALIHELCSEGYTADGVCDGKEGLEWIDTGLYDMVILDIMLPRMNGMDVLKTIRSRNNKIPVILLTARSDVEDKVHGMDCGADDYLTKPFAFPELLARIRMVTRRYYSDSLADNDIHAGSLALDTRKHQLASSATGKNIQLGTKEYQLLEYFMCNLGHILTREQITEKIWGYDSEAEYNNVDVYVSFLRKKIKFVSATAKIQSVRGVGYVLDVQEEEK